MHFSRIAAFLLGAWLLGSLFMAFVATQNFATVDRVLNSPPADAAKMIQTLRADNARHLLRYLAGEENRGFFESWELAQLVLGLALTFLLLFAVKNRALAAFTGAMLVLTAFQHWRITPDLVALGRSNEFIARAASSLARTQFGRLHAAYGVIEGVKLLLALTVAAFLFPRRHRRSRQRVEVDPVDHANHSHIDG
ncbi:MAG TPA: hypothetical protein VGV35_18515 [Bryobacteraceae bacterium]|nr:hypothetical protein [Bryobacteraceae bacterium]